MLAHESGCGWIDLSAWFIQTYTNTRLGHQSCFASWCRGGFKLRLWASFLTREAVLPVCNETHGLITSFAIANGWAYVSCLQC